MIRKFLIVLIYLLSSACAVLSAMYLVEYLLQFVGVITPIRGVLANVIFIENFVSQFYSGHITFMGKMYSNSYLFCSLILIIFSLITHKMTDFVNHMCDYLDKIIYGAKKTKDNIYRFFIDKKVVQNFSKTNNFYVSLKLDFESPALKDNNEKQLFMRETAYKSIQNVLKKFDFVNASTKEEKLIIISKDFKKIDEVIVEFLKQVQKITRANSESQIQTNAFFLLDVLENNEFSEENILFVNKILKYDYKNKVVATSLFSEKYRTEINGRFQTISLGTIRIYKNELVKQNEIDIFDEQGQNNDFEDIELHLFKLKQAKKI